MGSYGVCPWMKSESAVCKSRKTDGRTDGADLDGVDVMVRGRGDERDARLGGAQARDVFIDLLPRQLPALACVVCSVVVCCIGLGQVTVRMSKIRAPYIVLHPQRRAFVPGLAPCAILISICLAFIRYSGVTPNLIWVILVFAVLIRLSQREPFLPHNTTHHTPSARKPASQASTHASKAASKDARTGPRRPA